MKTNSQENDNSDKSHSSSAAPDIIVTGDSSTDRFIYLEGFADQSPNLRDAWVNARKFWNITLAGGAGTLAEYMLANNIKAIDPCRQLNSPESIYMLTRKKDDKSGHWYVDKAIVAGERDYPSGDLNKCATDLFALKIPCAILDFNQGWVKQNKQILQGFLRGRSFIIRSHDPCKDHWRELRRQKNVFGIWFSPIQDMAEGSLWFPGNWENLRDRLLDYLRADGSLFSNGKWRQYAVIQISYDGALLVGPSLSKEGELYIFSGDQPGSFSREGYGTVVAGGIVFVATLAEALLSGKKPTADQLRDCIKNGLCRVRQLVKNGYVDPDEKVDDWKVSTNLPTDALKITDGKHIVLYTEPPKADWETACRIVCGTDDEVSRNTVFKLGKLLTASPDYAHTLLRLTSRLESHLKNDTKVLSFAIFGGPGSGKSFVAKQIAKSIDPASRYFEYRTFNISQFAEPSRLVDAFNQIQSISLQGKIPFILWDEFDTSLNGHQAGWLSSFLMPMQDAEFFDGSKNQALGKMVYVFIGGTFSNDEEFGRWSSGDEGKTQKGTDFHSRLDSSLTVPSVEYRETSREMHTTRDPVRLVRAVLLKTFLAKAKKIKSISQDVLSFLLHVPLEHGVRSLEKIVNASELNNTVSFQMYHLPPMDVLSLHVDSAKLATFSSITDFMQVQQDRHAKKDPLTLAWKK